MSSDRHIRHSLDPFTRGLVFGLLGVGALIAVAFWVDIAVNPPGQLVFAILWSLIVIVNIYRHVLRCSFEIALENDYLEWRGVVAHGRTTFSNLQRIRPSRFDPFVHVIERSNGRAVLVWGNNANSEFRAVCHLLLLRRPGLEVRFQRKPGL